LACQIAQAIEALLDAKVHHVIVPQLFHSVDEKDFESPWFSWLFENLSYGTCSNFSKRTLTANGCLLALCEG
jgi:hypothetical protein